MVNGRAVSGGAPLPHLIFRFATDRLTKSPEKLVIQSVALQVETSPCDRKIGRGHLLLRLLLLLVNVSVYLVILVVASVVIFEISCPTVVRGL